MAAAKIPPHTSAASHCVPREEIEVWDVIKEGLKAESLEGSFFMGIF